MQPLHWPLLRYYITDRKQLPGPAIEQRARLLGLIERAAADGVEYVQLREKDLPVRELERLALDANERVIGTHTKLLINSRTDVAIACRLHGVHLRGDPEEMSASEVRAIFAEANVPSPLIAVSCHTLAQVESAYSHGADFVVFGPVFQKDDEVGLGLERLRGACAVPIPVLALGGVTKQNAGGCIRAGAKGIAGIRYFQRV